MFARVAGLLVALKVHRRRAGFARRHPNGLTVDTAHSVFRTLRKKSAGAHHLIENAEIAPELRHPIVKTIAGAR
jgi:hypothetical protein